MNKRRTDGWTRDDVSEFGLGLVALILGGLALIVTFALLTEW